MSSNWNPKDEWNRLLVESQVKDLLAETEEELDIEETLLDDAYPVKKCETWKDLNTLMGVLMHAQELKDIGEKGGAVGSAAMQVLKLIPGTAAFANWVEAGSKGLSKGKDVASGMYKSMKKMQDLPDNTVENSPGGIYDALKIDDGYQDITDEKLEDSFLKYFAKYVAEQAEKNPDGDLPDKDINTYFEEYLANHQGLSGETVTGAEEDTKLTEIPTVDIPDEDRSKIFKSGERIATAVGGSLKGFLGL